MIVLDTNIISELMKVAPDESVVRWVSACAPADLYTTSITKAEILHGILLLPSGKRRNAFATAAEAVFSEEFSGRILSFDSDAAHHYANIAVARRRAGRPIAHFDVQIAAIAYSAGAGIATRNVKDFDLCGVKAI